MGKLSLDPIPLDTWLFKSSEATLRNPRATISSVENPSGRKAALCVWLRKGRRLVS